MNFVDLSININLAAIYEQMCTHTYTHTHTLAVFMKRKEPPPPHLFRSYFEEI